MCIVQNSFLLFLWQRCVEDLALSSLPRLSARADAIGHTRTVTGQKKIRQMRLIDGPYRVADYS